MVIKDWNPEPMTGYKPITTFYSDFSIADHFGSDAIVDTYKRAFEEWKNDYKYLTELVMVLNWKIWEHYETKPSIASVYSELWETTAEYASENLKGSELRYYYEVTD